MEKNICIKVILMFLCGIFFDFIYFFRLIDDYRVLFITSNMVRSAYFVLFIAFNSILLWMVIKHTDVQKHVVFLVAGIIMITTSTIFNVLYYCKYDSYYLFDFYIKPTEDYVNNFVFVVVYNVFTIGLFIAYIRCNKEKTVLSKMLIVISLILLSKVIYLYYNNTCEIDERKEKSFIYKGLSISDESPYFSFKYNGFFETTASLFALEPYSYPQEDAKYDLINIEKFDNVITEDLEQINKEKQYKNNEVIDIDDCIKVNDNVMRTDILEEYYEGYTCYVIDDASKRYVKFNFDDEEYEDVVLEMIGTLEFY